jgi:hypothetical protein
MFVSFVAMGARICSHKHILKMQAAAHIIDVSVETTDLGGSIYLGSMYILQ